MKKMYMTFMVFMVLLCNVAVAQRTITGTVTSVDDGEPIIGANVVVEGDVVGTTTDTNGRYILTVDSQARNLIFSYVGMGRRTVAIAESNEINVALQTQTSTFDDVVVTAIAIKREQRSLGYGSTTVKTDELTTVSDRSALDALRGKVSGVNITSANGDPGASTRIVLRGGSSILGNNQALIVVDGVPIDNSNFGAGTDPTDVSDVLNNNYDAGNRANDINPANIESITVLKGASAAALYGQRGANGALIITTKTGSRTAQGGRKFKVSYSSDFKFSNILRLPEYQNEYGQGGQKFPDPRENFSWGPKFDGVVRPWGQEVNGKQRVKPYSALPDNIKNFFDLAKTYTNNISIEGGNKTTSYFLSYGNVKNKGVLPGTTYDRNSVQTNVAHNFSDKLSSTVNITYTKTQQRLYAQGQGDYSVYDQIIQTPRDIPLDELKDLTDSFNLPETYYGAYTLNPYYVMANHEITTNVDRLNAAATIVYAPLKWLDFTGRFGADVYTDVRYQRLTKFNFDNQSFNNEYVGKYSEDLYRSNIYNSDLIVSAGHTFKKGITIGALIGNNIYASAQRTTSVSTAGLNIDDLFTLGNSKDRPDTKSYLGQRRVVGVYAELNFDYKKFLFVNVTLRNDWSSTLPKKDNSYFYPGANASFVLTDAVKINKNILSYLKIRAAFALVGSGGESPYLLTNVYEEGFVDDGYFESSVKTPYPSGDERAAGYSFSDLLRNPELKPEGTTEWEVGTEIGFWNDRVNIDFTYYQRFSDQQIIISDQAPSSGFSSKVVNAGRVSNKGVELGVNLVPVSLKNSFRWEIYGTFTKNDNKVEDLPEGVDQISLGGISDLQIVAREGQPYQTFYGITARRDAEGRIIVDANSGQPLMDDEPKVLGTYQPKWLGSLGTSLSWKGLRFNILFDTRQGGKIWSRTMDVSEFVGTSPNTLNNDREDFIVPNSVIEVSEGVFEPNTTVKANHQDYWTIYNNADRGAHLLPASFTKLREVSLSYSLPVKALRKSRFITGVEIKVYGSNLALWTPKVNTFIDPETSSYGAGNAQGFEYGTTPSLRNIGFGFKLDF